MVCGTATLRSEPINRSYLARFTLGNVALEREVLQLFAQQMPLYLEQLNKAETQADWKLVTHSIKGAALAIGAEQLASAAQSAEKVEVGSPHCDGNARAEAAQAVAIAAEDVCKYIACLFATG